MNAAPARLYFHFDFISHNAWLAWGRAREIAERHGLVFRPVPVVFGVLLKASGGLGPAEIPGKSRWMLRDVVRKSLAHGIPLVPPHSHPFNPLPALRIACASVDDDTRIRLIDTLFRATWAQGLEVSNPAVLRDTLTAAGFDGAALIAESESPDVKARLRLATDEAIAAGVFGVPTMLVRGRLFWGFDDLPNLEAFLEGRDPLESVADFSAWEAVRPSVQRLR